MSKTVRDGRFIDSRAGILEAEASHQLAENHPAKFAAFDSVPSEWLGDQSEPTYYGRPLLKPTVWTWMIPAYFFFGGLAGASMTLGGVSQGLRGRAGRPLAFRCFAVGSAAGTIGSVLLIADLGKPSRFLNMLRVIRVTSPMSIGSWILSGATTLSSGAAILPGAWGRAAGYGAALLGIPLSGYTAVLIANTAVPVWQETRRSTPVLFVGSAMASSGAVLKLLGPSASDVRIASAFGVAGAIVDLAASRFVERGVSSGPLRRGAAGAMWTAAQVCTVLSVALAAWPGRAKKRKAASAILGLAGSLCLRFAIFEAGKTSARDPRESFRLQRKSAV